MSDKEINDKKVLNKKNDANRKQEIVFGSEFLIVPFRHDINNFPHFCNYLINTYHLDELIFIDNDSNPLTPVITRRDKNGIIKDIQKIYVSRNGDFAEQSLGVERINLDKIDDPDAHDGKKYYLNFIDVQSYDYLNSFVIMGLRFQDETFKKYNQQYKRDISLKTYSVSNDIATNMTVVFSNKMDNDIEYQNNILHISCNHEYGSHLFEYCLYTRATEDVITADVILSPDLTLVIEGQSEMIKKFQVASNQKIVLPTFDQASGLGSFALHPTKENIFVKPKVEMDLTCRWMMRNKEGKMVDLVVHQVHFAPSSLLDK